MMTLTDKEKRNFKKFRAELTALSQKYGVAIKSIGGISIGEIGAPQQAA